MTKETTPPQVTDPELIVAMDNYNLTQQDFSDHTDPKTEQGKLGVQRETESVSNKRSAGDTRTKVAPKEEVAEDNGPVDDLKLITYTEVELSEDNQSTGEPTNLGEAENQIPKNDAQVKRGRVSREQAKLALQAAYLSGPVKDNSAREYLDNRPAVGTQVSVEEHANNLYDSSMDRPLEEMGVSELAGLLARAELDGDSTKQRTLNDIVLDRLMKIEVAHSKKAQGPKGSVSRLFSDKGGEDPVTNLLDRFQREVDRQKTAILSNDETDGEDIKLPNTESDNQEAEATVIEPNEYGYVAPKYPGKLPAIIEQVDPNGETQEMPVVGKLSIRDRIRNLSKRMNESAVRFDGKDHNGNKVPGKKVGDAIIDTSNREYKGKHVLAIAGLGVLAAGAAYLTSKGFNFTPKSGDGLADVVNQAVAGAKSARQSVENNIDVITANKPNTGTADIINNFVVEKGHGYTHELVDFANTQGIKLPSNRAWELHQHLIDKFGGDYINFDGPGADTYKHGSDFRLTRPGNAQWAKGVQAEITKWLTANR